MATVRRLLANNLLYIGSLRTFRPLPNFKLDRLSFLQSAIAFANDSGIMNENIRTIIAPDEAVAFCIIEPLHLAFHFLWSPRMQILKCRFGRAYFTRCSNEAALCDLESCLGTGLSRRSSGSSDRTSAREPGLNSTSVSKCLRAKRCQDTESPGVSRSIVAGTTEWDYG